MSASLVLSFHLSFFVILFPFLPLLPLSISSLSLLFCSFAFCITVSFPFPLFIVLYQCHLSLYLFLTSWLFKHSFFSVHFFPFLSSSDLCCWGFFLGICTASPPVSICGFPSINSVSSHSFSLTLALSFLFFFPLPPLYASAKHSLSSFLSHLSFSLCLPFLLHSLCSHYMFLCHLAPCPPLMLSSILFLCSLSPFFSSCLCALVKCPPFYLLFLIVFLSSCLPVFCLLVNKQITGCYSILNLL